MSSIRSPRIPVALLLLAAFSLTASAGKPPRYMDGDGIEMSKGQVLFVRALHNDLGNGIYGSSRLIIRNTDASTPITIQSATVNFGTSPSYECVTSPVIVEGFETWSATSYGCTNIWYPTEPASAFPYFLVEWTSEGHVRTPMVDSVATLFVVEGSVVKITSMTSTPGQVIGIPIAP